jgi:thiamine biosynthesis lipoprotein ApbE
VILMTPPRRFLARPGMEIDLGAIAKGYIADRVRDDLQRQEWTRR